MRNWFTKDFGWKLFSLFLALAIWLTVHKLTEEPKPGSDAAVGDKVTYDDLPVTPISAGADVHDFRVVPPTVAVEVSGPSEVMAVLQANQIRAVVDLTGLGKEKDSRQPVEVVMPRGVTLVSVKPPRVGIIVPPTPEKTP